MTNDRGACHLSGDPLNAVKIVHFGSTATPDNHGTMPPWGHRSELGRHRAGQTGLEKGGALRAMLGRSMAWAQRGLCFACVAHKPTTSQAARCCALPTWSSPAG